MAPETPGSRPPLDGRPPGPDEEFRPAEYEEEARLFYERLEQTGQLTDVDTDTNLNTLPPRITHVRYPDGTVERVRFTSSP